MSLRLARRFLSEPDKRLLLKFCWNFGLKGLFGVHRFRRRLARGKQFPAFVFLSVTSECNLRCQGCWVTGGSESMRLDPVTVKNCIASAKSQGSYFFGILGGEPLMYEGLLDVMGANPDCYFQVFTNGTMMDDAMAAEFRRLGNVTPLISVEGVGAAADKRRGGRDVYERSLSALEACKRHGLIAGVATSVCQSNYDAVVCDEFLDVISRKGALYVWYYIYRPVGALPCPELALSAEQITGLRRYIVDSREYAPLAVIDAYWDQDGHALCPAALGLSHHIGPTGFIEPCPPVQLACERVSDGSDLVAVIEQSQFLRGFKRMAQECGGGCVLLDKPERLAEFAKSCDVTDSSGRGTVLAEIEAMRACPGHHQAGREIPERAFFYRFAKRNFFFGFGAYG